MATSGVIADFSRMSSQRKVLVFAVIGVVLGLVYWKFFYQSLGDKLDAAQAAQDAKLQTNRKLAADLPRYEELRTHLTRLRELIEKNQTALPSAPELPAFFETLQHKVAEAGVEVRKWTNRGEEPVESFMKVPVDVEITGTFMQIKRFFASLVQRDVRLGQSGDDRGGEDRERIVSIENLALTMPSVKNREIFLTAKFTAVTFRQEDKSIPTKPASGPSAPGAAKPTGSAPAAAPPAVPPTPPPPLPSAATPAGAKARTENAVEKGDARNRNAAGAGEPKPSTGSNRLKGGI
jgi:type IV pilus assembly protein PilO